MKNRILFLTQSLLLFLLLFLTACTQELTNKACFHEECYSVEIADDYNERSQGLMFRENLPEGEGMLFVFPEEGEHYFWMKNTLIPLDMIWLDENKEVIFITKANPCKEDPCQSYGPKQKSLYVLELNQGEVKRIGLEVGDEIKLK